MSAIHMKFREDYIIANLKMSNIEVKITNMIKKIDFNRRVMEMKKCIFRVRERLSVLIYQTLIKCSKVNPNYLQS